jgi:hypothetical protein
VLQNFQIRRFTAKKALDGHVSLPMLMGMLSDHHLGWKSPMVPRNLTKLNKREEKGNLELRENRSHEITFTIKHQLLLEKLR